MYTINIDSRPLYTPRLRDYTLKSPVLKMKASKAGSLTFTVPPTHAEIRRFVKLQTVCSVYKGGQYPIWRGRVFFTRLNMNGSLYVECEGLLSYLLDTNMRTYEYKGTLQGFLQLILDTHNAQATPAQQIRLGVVTVTDDNDYINRSSTKYISCWEALESGLIKTHGGVVRLRYTADGTVLDWLKGDSNDLYTSTQAIEYGENLTDLTQEVSAEETYTVCIPLGAKQESDSDTGTSEETRLTIKSVNGGLDYIVNEEAFNKYGWICAPISETTWDDVTLATNLLRKGRQYLDGVGVKLRDTITLTAVDLHNKNADIRAFSFLDLVPVRSTPHGIGGMYLLSEMSIPLSNPKGATITLGDTRHTLIDDHISDLEETAQNVIETVTGTIEDGLRDANEQIAQTALTLQSTLDRTAREIMSQMAATYTSATSFEEYQKTVSTLLSQTAEAFTFQFDSLTKQITTLNGETNQQFSEISKYIRFIDGAIELGRSDSALILRIMSDRISYLLNNVEIAYFSSGRLYVENLEAIRTLTVGNFSYLPRNNGNLSLKMINPNTALARWNGTTTLVWDDLGSGSQGESVAVMALWNGATPYRWNELETDAVWNDAVEETTYYNVVAMVDRNLQVEYESSSIAEGSSFTATLTALPGYTIDRVFVRMGGVDISETAYAGGKIYIPRVTGIVGISAYAKKIETTAVLGLAVVGAMKLGTITSDNQFNAILGSGVIGTMKLGEV